MSTDWLAPVSTAAVGLAGIAATYLSGRRQIATARDVAERQAAHALEAQREERHQRRIEAVYPALLDMLAEGRTWLWRVDTFTRGDTEDSRPPKMPEWFDRLEHNGEQLAVWSPRVAGLVREWAAGAGSAYAAAHRLSYFWEQEGRQQPTIPPPLQREALTLEDVFQGRATNTERLVSLFGGSRDKAFAAETKLREQVWREMRSEDRGYDSTR